MSLHHATPLFRQARALVIDANQTLRSTTIRQLRDLGVVQVQFCRGLVETRQLLERLRFDLVLCADVIDQQGQTGQNLLEELRRDGLLPHSTVFAMLASEATFLRVMEAAEAALDCFVLRPCRTDELEARLSAALLRKRQLAGLMQALDDGDVERALAECRARMRAGGEYAQLCSRTAAELLLKEGRAAEARALFAEQQAQQASTWSSLGMARALLAVGDLAPARQQAQALLEREPALPDGHDLLGRILLEQGELNQALDSYQKALSHTPQCLLRLQHCGSLAFYLDERDTAVAHLERARFLGAGSRLFDAMTLLLLALLHVDRRDSRALTVVRKALDEVLARYADSRRLRRMDQALQGLTALAQGQLDEAQQQMLLLAQELDADDFDLEAAVMLVSLWVRLPPREVHAGLQQQQGRALGLRFCMSRAANAVLSAAARRSDTLLQVLLQAQHDIGQLAEAALKPPLRHDIDAAVTHLLDHGEHTRNARLISMAGRLLARRGHLAQQSDALKARHAGLQQRYCRPVTHLAGQRRSSRSAGGLLVRLSPMAPAADAAPLLHAGDHTSPLPGAVG